MVEVASRIRSSGSAALATAPIDVLRQGRYELRFATRAEELDDILRMRFEVFNLELGEGLEESFATGRDRDDFDDVCHHLMVIDRRSAGIVGTYRVQTSEMAASGDGFYSSDEFDLGALPAAMLSTSVELGRACIAREHRNRKVLFLLWRGLARYLSTFSKRYLFGCCSLTSQDPQAGLSLYRRLEREGRLHPNLETLPVGGFECVARTADVPRADEVEVPTLFATYLRYGALVCSPPAMDRRFKTIDYLVLLDTESLDPTTVRLFFG